MSGSCGWFPLGRDEILAWVEAHRHELPRTLTELSRFPMPFRKEIVLAHTPEARIALWREHMESFLVPEAGLTADQQALVRDAIADLRALFGESREVGLARATALDKRARELVTREQAYAMFGSIGPREPPEGLPLPRDVNLPAPSE
jgi:hypothetical protein